MFRHFSLAIFRFINENTKFFFSFINLKMANENAETCSCSLCNKFYTYLYHHIAVLDKYIHSSLVYYEHDGDDEPHDPF